MKIDAASSVKILSANLFYIFNKYAFQCCTIIRVFLYL